MRIAVQNLTSVSRNDIIAACAAFTKQLQLHVAPAWGFGGTVEPVEAGGTFDAVLQLANNPPQGLDGGVEGYHDESKAGQLRAYVFKSVSDQFGEPWTVTASHELCELVGNPYTTFYAYGRHPTKNYVVFYWRELADAVQERTYSVDGVQVSDFVLPAYFDRARKGAQLDYLSTRGLKPLATARGGYVGYYDPRLGSDQTYFPKTDTVARARFDAKSAVPGLRRGALYSRKHG